MRVEAIKTILKIVAGTFTIFISISLVAFGLDQPILALASMVIAPIVAIVFNLKVNINPIKYYIGLVLVVFISAAICLAVIPENLSPAQEAILGEDFKK